MMGQGSSAGDIFGMRDMFLKERSKLEYGRKKAEAPSPMQVPTPLCCRPLSITHLFVPP